MSHANRQIVTEEQGGNLPIPPEEGLQPLTRQQASDYLRERWGLSYAIYSLAAYAAKGTGPATAKLAQGPCIYGNRSTLGRRRS